MSNLIDKLRTLINAQMRGPRKPSKPQQPAQQQPPAPPAASAVPEVTEGRARKPRTEVSETAPEAAMPKPAVAEKPAPPSTADELDKGRVADMLKPNQKK